MSCLFATVVRSLSPAWMLAFAIVGVTGCQTLFSSRPHNKELADGNTPAAPTCEVVMRDSGGHTRPLLAPVADGTTVNSVLEFANAGWRFRKFDVTVLRKGRSADTGRPTVQEMNCEFDTKARGVTFETDYAIRPGDRVLIEEQESSPISEALGILRNVLPG